MLEIKVINYKIPVADTGDEEYRAFVMLSIISLVSMIVAVKCKKKFVG